jgi:RNA polymerase sigma factor (sigma-70 family)
MVDWQDILTEHRTRLWRAVYRVLGHYDDALECCQEALLDAHELALKETVTEWGALLTTLGTRRAIDRLRSRLSRRQFEVSLGNVPEPVVNIGGPVQSAEAAELLEDVRRLVAALPHKQAEAFWLVCIEGVSSDEVAHRLGITPNETRVLVHRARARVAQSLNDRQLRARRNR